MSPLEHKDDGGEVMLSTQLLTCFNETSNLLGIYDCMKLQAFHCSATTRSRRVFIWSGDSGLEINA